MGLPSSGIISGSQVGVYVFNRSAIAEFSLSASLAGSTTSKGYSTTFGPIWRGVDSFQGDIDNQQYNQGANNFSLSDWYGYWKGVSVSIGDPSYENPGDVCNDSGEDEAFSTEFTYWNSIYNGVRDGLTVVYVDSDGVNTLDDGGNYRACYSLYGYLGLQAVGQFQNGIFTYANFYCD